jgi:hypothetical protein
MLSLSPASDSLEETLREVVETLAAALTLRARRVPGALLAAGTIAGTSG